MSFIPFIPPPPGNTPPVPTASLHGDGPVIPPQPGGGGSGFGAWGPQWGPASGGGGSRMHTPYTHPAAMPGFAEGGFFGASPRVAQQQPGQNGFSDDWIGFGPQTGAGSGGGSAAGWGAWGPSAGAPGTPWHAAPQMMGMGAPAPGTGWSSFTQSLPPQGFGAPPGAYGAYPMGTPYGYFARMPSGSLTPWAGDGFAPLTPNAPAAATLAEPVSGMMRPSVEEGLDTRFMAGKHYGPVLDPVLVAATDCSPKVNPLLWPPPGDPTSREFLTWNMLFSPTFVHRSSEPANYSWTSGRDLPATFPRVTSLRIVSRRIPWVAEITARHRRTGVTCGDLIDQLGEFLNAHVEASAFEACPDGAKRRIRQTYYLNRSMADGVPGGRLGEGLRRCDWLGEDTMFDGIETDEEFARERLGMPRRSTGDMDLPCVFVLKCIRRLPMTQEERREQDAREAAAG